MGDDPYKTGDPYKGEWNPKWPLDLEREQTDRLRATLERLNLDNQHLLGVTTQIMKEAAKAQPDCTLIFNLAVRAIRGDKNV